MPEIMLLHPDDAVRWLPQLIRLVQDAVDSGASGCRAGARHVGRQLLVLDTRPGNVAERLYARMGYRRVGVIPKFALSSEGRLDATVIFYRDLAT